MRGNMTGEEIKLPRGQVLQESIYDTNENLKQIITSNPQMDKWFFYSVDKKGGITKLDTGKSPYDFEPHQPYDFEPHQKREKKKKKEQLRTNNN